MFFVAEAANDGDDGDADMLQKQYLQRVMGVQRAIEGASFISAVDGETRGFESLCFKPIDGEGCLVESPSQYWLDDPVLLAGDPSPSLTAACQTSDAFLASRSPCMDKVGGSLCYITYLSGQKCEKHSGINRYTPTVLIFPSRVVRYRAPIFC